MNSATRLASSLKPSLPWRGVQGRRVNTAVLVFAAYYLGGKLGLALTFFPNPISVLWPPNAIVFAALLLTPVASWWVVLAAAFSAHMLAELQGGVPLSMVLAWYVSNATEALIGAVCVRALVRRELTFRTLEQVLAFMVAAVAATFFSSFIDSAFVTVIGWGQSSYWTLWKTRFAANVLASLIVVPLIVTWAHARDMSSSAWTWRRIGEAATLLIALVVITMLVFTSNVVSHSTALLYLPLPLLVWAALRFGAAAITTLLAIVALLVIWGAGHGLGPFIGSASGLNALDVQLFLISVASCLLLLTAVLQERQSAAAALRRSQQYFQRVFHRSPAAMGLIGRNDRRVIDVNARWLAVFGYERREVIGRTIDELRLYVDPRQREVLAESAAANGVVDGEALICTRDRQIRHAAIAMDSINIDGEDCFITSVVDITERRQAEQALRISDERFRLVLEATRDVVYDRDLSTGEVWWSRNALRQFGYDNVDSPPEWAALLHEEDRHRVVEQLEDAIAAGVRLCEADYRIVRADGTFLHAHEQGFIVRDCDGNAQRVIGAITDVTELRLRDELQGRLAHVSRLTTMGELSASIAHEVNQPISAILSNADAAEMLLDKAPLSVDELRQVLCDIRDDGVRAGEIIRHVRGLAGKPRPDIAPYDMNEVVASALRIVTPEAQRRRIRVRAMTSALPIVKGDRIYVQQVVLNLLLNSMDAMEDIPAACRTIEVRTSLHSAGRIQVEVADSGHGISEQDREKVFQSFYTTKKHGMGIGLSIARSLIREQRGSIWADTNPLGGAIVRFTVPTDLTSRDDTAGGLGD